MVIVKKRIYDVRKGEEQLVDEDIEIPPLPVMPEPIDLEDVRRLIKYAKQMGWIS